MVLNLPQIQFTAGLMLHIVRFSEQHYQEFWTDGMWQLHNNPPTVSIIVQQDVTLYRFYSLQIALHVSGDIFTHHQEHE
jgi:hypothetical protein